MTPHIDVGWLGPDHGCWSWVQSHFLHLHRLQWEQVDDWATAKRKGTDAPKRALLVGLEHRSDPNWQTLKDQISQWQPYSSSGSPRAILLGSDWQGHRRTHPLPDTVEAFYWFQIHDRVLPWLMRSTTPGPTKRSARRARDEQDASPAPSLRIQRILEHEAWARAQWGNTPTPSPTALVVTDHAAPRSAWWDFLTASGFRCIASNIHRQQPWCEPDLVIIDCVAREDGQAADVRGAVAGIRQQHRESFLVLADPFPVWERWAAWLDCGVNALIPRPADWHGVLLMWKRWRQMRVGEQTSDLL